MAWTESDHRRAQQSLRPQVDPFLQHGKELTLGQMREAPLSPGQVVVKAAGILRRCPFNNEDLSQNRKYTHTRRKSTRRVQLFLSLQKKALKPPFEIDGKLEGWTERPGLTPEEGGPTILQQHAQSPRTFSYSHSRSILICRWQECARLQTPGNHWCLLQLKKRGHYHPERPHF